MGLKLLKMSGREGVKKKNYVEGKGVGVQKKMDVSGVEVLLTKHLDISVESYIKNSMSRGGWGHQKLNVGERWMTKTSNLPPPCHHKRNGPYSMIQQCLPVPF